MGGKGGKGGKGGSSEEGSSEEMGFSSEEMGDGEDKAMCADPEMLGAICVAGTDLGAKMEAAMAECSGGEEMAAGRARNPKPSKGKGKGKGKGKPGKGGKKGKGGKGGKCPSFDELIEKIDAETAGHRCVIEKMGWMDSDGNMVKEVHDADMATLNKDLTDRIDEQEIEDCSNKAFEMMSKKYGDNKCGFDDDQVETLSKIGMQMAQGKCAQKVFMKACGEYVKESFMAFMMEANGVAGK